MKPRKLSMILTNVTLDDILKAYPVQNRIWARSNTDSKLYTLNYLYNALDPWCRKFPQSMPKDKNLPYHLNTSVEGVIVICVVFAW